MYGIIIVNQSIGHNQYKIDRFIPEFNKQFAREVKPSDSVIEKITEHKSLHYILAVLSTRNFNSGNSISYKGSTYLPYNEDDELVCYRNGTECTVIEAFDKKLYVQVYNEIFILKKL